VRHAPHPTRDRVRALLTALDSGLAWHTDDQTLRTKFEEFGEVQEAVSHGRRLVAQLVLMRADRCQGSRHWSQPRFRLRPFRPGLRG
jgi:hypothetical protein